MDWEDLKRKVNELRMKEEDEGEGWEEGEDWEGFDDEWEEEW